MKAVGNEVIVDVLIFTKRGGRTIVGQVGRSEPLPFPLEVAS